MRYKEFLQFRDERFYNMFVMTETTAQFPNGSFVEQRIASVEAYDFFS